MRCSGGCGGRVGAALREGTRGYWLECLNDSPEDALTYTFTAPALKPNVSATTRAV